MPASSPVTSTVTVRSRIAAPSILDWSSVPFQTSTSAVVAVFVASASTIASAPSPVTVAGMRPPASADSIASAQNRGLRRLPTVSRPNPPCSSRGGQPSSSNWSEQTQ